MPNKVKYYTVQISDEARSSHQNIWYKNKQGQKFRTKLESVENSSGKMVPAFKCIQSPFWHIYPAHCTIVHEENIEI